MRKLGDTIRVLSAAGNAERLVSDDQLRVKDARDTLPSFIFSSKSTMTTATLKQPTTEVAADAKSSKPLQVFRHRNLSASVFENQSKSGGSFLTVSLQRAYKDADDQYQHSSSFTRDEIPVARYLLDQAWEYMLNADAT